MISAISVDRCIGILKPLHQRHIMTPTRTKLIILATWLFGLAHVIPLISGLLEWKPGMICLVLYVVPDNYLHAITAEIYFFIIVLIIIYSITLRAVHQHQQRRRAHQIPGQKSESVFIENVRLVKAFAIVVGIFILSWLPFSILAEASKSLNDDYIQSSTFTLIYKISVALVYINSAANPVIYAMRITSFRVALQEQLCYKTKNKAQPPSLQQHQSKNNDGEAADTDPNGYISQTLHAHISDNSMSSKPSENGDVGNI